MKKKLVAIWVENYMQIQKQGFNFGSNNTFNFSFNEEKRSLTITTEKVENYFDLFKNDSFITNITGIVGINGSGKTSLLKLLNNLSAGKYSSHQPSVVLIFEENTSYNFYIPSKKVTLSLDFINVIWGGIKYENPFKYFDLIFYSSTLSSQNDKYLDNEDKPNMLNRSASYQFMQSLNIHKLENYIRSHKKQYNENRIISYKVFNPLKLYEKDKLERQIKFLNWANILTKNNLYSIIGDITIPSQITIWFEEDEQSLDMILNSITDNKNDLIKSYSDCIQKNHKILDLKKRLLDRIFFYLDMVSYNHPKAKERKSLLDFFNAYLNNTDRGDFSTFDGKKERLKSLITPIQITQNKTSDQQTINITINYNAWAFLSFLFDIFRYIPLELNYSLNPKSTGEEAFITQFSEFYTAITHLIKSPNKSNVIISIDEGESYFHPEWQRKYIHHLYTFFDLISKELRLNKSFQLIITSHSPFIVSDIPHYNIIKLNKDEKGNCEVVQSKKATLGGNIFELFEDDFYVNEFISAFAFEKIKQAILFLQGKESSFTIEDVKAFIPNIGESLIRNQLEKMLERYENNSRDFETVELG
ncbi:AAA family ATPase [Arcicella sp. DC2W]|uniref:AAA family ATPase n=1 Tax=Arcicella gelida TaxID=2984195 RepID=A0ABU5SAR7_9BACT|nr:AAA family ATPase [Arcicella sp. DC2W]MEA5405560.1 AAA family ATPase [Arcicella sp. DC2W]